MCARSRQVAVAAAPGTLPSPPADTLHPSTVCCRQSNLPTNARLAVTKASGQMRVTWTTKDKPPSPTVMWGTSPGKYTGSAQGISWAYTKADMCDAPANSTGW